MFVFVWRLPGWAGLLMRPRRSSATSAAALAAIERRCFSVFAVGGRAVLHLQLPPGGNGRSRQEWVDALSGVLGGRQRPL